MHPAEIAGALREIAVYLELDGDRYRARAYQRAADSISGLQDVSRLVAEGRLTELPGIGDSLARLIAEIDATGQVAMLDRLRARWPATVVELARLPGVGAAKARILHEALVPADLDELARMCDLGRVRALAGFGRVSEARLRDAIRARHTTRPQLLLPRARELGEALAAHLRAAPAVREVAVCGAARRWVEVVDRIVLAVATTDVAAVRDRLHGHPLASQCDLVCAPPVRFGAAMVIATGSDAHVAALRARAGGLGTELEAIDAADEAALYRALGLPLLPPEVRDGTDELDGGDLSDLVTLADITGAVHCHTVHSDGRNTIEEMAIAAERRGLGLLTITDHSATASYAGGLGADELRAQRDEIALVQRRVGIRVLFGTEADILKDGELDYPAELAGDLEVVIASVHQRHKLDEDGMTRRLVTAMRQPIFKIWGHALGRLLLGRPPIAVRFDEVLDAIGESQAAIEINGDPHRLDLDPERARQARARGIQFVLSTDAHSVRQLDYLEYAVGMARRARIRKREVLNARPPDELARALSPRGRAG